MLVRPREIGNERKAERERGRATKKEREREKEKRQSEVLNSCFVFNSSESGFEGWRKGGREEGRWESEDDN